MATNKKRVIPAGKPRIVAKVPQLVKVRTLNTASITEMPFKALLGFIKETPTMEDWNILSFRCFVGLELAKLFQEETELEDIVNGAVGELDEILMFYSYTGKLSALENQTKWINSALIVIEQMQEMCGVPELLAAYKATDTRISNIKRLTKGV
jgi:hypothetical protein